MVTCIYNIYSYFTVLCLSLPLLTNGTISYSDPTLGEGSVATHSCDTGYTLNRGSTSCRTCQSDGTWSGSALACEGLRVLIMLDTCCMNRMLLLNAAMFIIKSDVSYLSVTVFLSYLFAILTLCVTHANHQNNYCLLMHLPP